MTFEEIPIRMLQLGVDREWIVKQCDYAPGTLAAILAPKGNLKHKTDKALRRIWEALDREAERQMKPAPQEFRNTFIIRPTADEFTNWNQASLAEGLTVEQWALTTLDRAAKEHYSKRISLVAAEEPSLYKTNSQS